MRRFVFSIMVAFGLVLVGAGSASAEPTPAAGEATAVPAKKVCKIVDPRLDELSGLIATKDGFITVNDSAIIASHKRIFFLDNTCKIVKQVEFSGNGPRDTEDLALAPDGKTLWIGDTGDNERQRTTIGLWKMDIGSAKKPVLYRLAYPDGDGPFDAEGLMINGDGSPIVVTKEANKVSLFTPTAALRADTTYGIPMKRAADIKLPASTTPNPLGPLGRIVATDAAVSPDRSKVVIRSYADAFQWPVSGGDLLAAVKGTPVATPLPNETQGESIAYSPDGAYFYTVQDMQGKPGGANYILRYTPVAKAVTVKSAAGSTTGGSATPSFLSRLSLDDITYLVGAVGVIGAILVGFGIFGIVRSRRRPPFDPAALDGSPDGPLPIDAQTELLAVGGARGGQRPGVYGHGGPQQSGTYGRPGGPPAAGGAPQHGEPRRGSGVYGADPAGGRPAPGVAPSGRPVPGGSPSGRPIPGGAQPGARPGAGGQPVGRPGQGGQPAGRPAPAPGGGQGGRPGGGVYGAPPSPPPPGRGGQGGPSQRPSGFAGRGGGDSDGGRQVGPGNNYADVHGAGGRSRDMDNPGYGRSPYSR
jgi:hypothetical protein